MTCPSEKWSSGEIIICPNCGSHRIEERQVAKSHKRDRHEIKMEDKIKEWKPQSFPFLMVGDFVPITIQLVLTCQECGYTITKNIEKGVS